MFVCFVIYKRLKAIEENQLHFTRDFVENIADLLESHKSDPTKLENLLELVLFFGISAVVEEHKQEVRGRSGREGRSLTRREEKCH